MLYTLFVILPESRNNSCTFYLIILKSRNRSLIFNINKRFDLDGDYKFNTARLINHSCDPNCEVFGEGMKIWIFAMKNIKKNEELSYDYGFSFDEDYRNFPCRCKSNKCVGYIIRQGSRWRVRDRKKI